MDNNTVKTMIESVKATLLLMLIMGMAVGLMLSSVLYTLDFFEPVNLEDMGIHAHESGDAVYVAGEACTINMEAKHTSLVELNEKYIFCTIKHQEYLDSLK